MSPDDETRSVDCRIPITEKLPKTEIPAMSVVII